MSGKEMSEDQPEPTWINDPGTGCAAWNPCPEENESINWSGDCVDGKASGNGVLQWFVDGEPSQKYEGQMFMGRADGHGIRTWVSGERCEGEWRDGIEEDTTLELTYSEQDPMAEVKVLLAFEHFGPAEEFVRKAISGEPDNLDYHNMMLKVFYKADNKSGFKEQAILLHELTNGQGNQWEIAQAMWQELSLDSTLFEERADYETIKKKAETEDPEAQFELAQGSELDS